MKGFRVPPQGSKKDQFNELNTKLANLEMAGRISQMMTQQLMQTVQNVSNDLGAALNQLYELEYKLGAVKKHLNLDEAALAKISNEQRLIDFNEASVKADAKENLIPAETVGEDSTVVITSVSGTGGEDKGIFRSRIKLSESGVPALIAGLQGKKVGEKVEVKLNETNHIVELLEIRNPAVVVDQPVEVTH